MICVVEKGVGKADCKRGRRVSVCRSSDFHHCASLTAVEGAEHTIGTLQGHVFSVRLKKRHSVKPKAADTRNEVGKQGLVWAFCEQKCLSALEPAWRGDGGGLTH